MLDSKTRTKFLCFAILFQIGVLLMVYGQSVYPIWFGQEVLLNVEPRDPRSLFRGNYARLNYDIDQIPLSDIDFQKRSELRAGEVIYVSLKKDSELWHFDKASIEQPISGIFLRGRLQRSVKHDTKHRTVRVKYGIDAFFAPKEKALQLERDIMNSRRDKTRATAHIMVAPNGKATLTNVVTSF